jgi:hypothetical protein
MFDWERAFKIFKIVFVTAFSIFILTMVSSVGEDYFEDIIAKPGYEVMDNLMRAYLRVDGYMAVVSLVITITSYIFYRVARTKRRRWH